MRRIGVCAAALLLAAALLTTAAAAGETYFITELEMAVTVPEGMVTFTRGMALNDPVFEEFGITWEQLEEQMRSGNIYLDTVSRDGSYEITIGAVREDTPDFVSLSDGELLEVAQGAEQGFEDEGFSMQGTEFYPHRDTKFIKARISWTSEGSEISGFQYFTGLNGWMIFVTANDYTGGEVTTLEAEAQTMVDDLYFYAAPVQPAQGTDYSAAESDAAPTDGQSGTAEGGGLAPITPGLLILNLLITVALYSLPIIIYRYAIRRDTVEPGRAKVITVVYGIVAFLAMAGLLSVTRGNVAPGGAILLWSFVNYRVLTGGRKGIEERALRAHREKQWENRAWAAQDGHAPEGRGSGADPAEPAARPSADLSRCPECGRLADPGERFCGWCGARLRKK